MQDRGRRQIATWISRAGENGIPAAAKHGHLCVQSVVAIAFTGDELGGNVAGRDALMGATSQAFRNAKKKKKKALVMSTTVFDGSQLSY